MSDTYSANPDLTNKASDIVRDVKAKASDLADNVSRAAKDNVSNFTDAAKGMAKDATDQVAASVSGQKSVGADYIASFAQATGRAADQFENDIPQAAQFIRQASEQIQGLADTVRERDARELLSDVQDFARRQPTLFFGGAVVLGFAALRFLKSAPPKSNGPDLSNAVPTHREG
jgi:methyl-accepting chemotaxis protein